MDPKSFDVADFDTNQFVNRNVYYNDSNDLDLTQQNNFPLDAMELTLQPNQVDCIFGPDINDILSMFEEETNAQTCANRNTQIDSNLIMAGLDFDKLLNKESNEFDGFSADFDSSAACVQQSLDIKPVIVEINCNQHPSTENDVMNASATVGVDSKVETKHMLGQVSVQKQGNKRSKAGRPSLIQMGTCKNEEEVKKHKREKNREAKQRQRDRQKKQRQEKFNVCLLPEEERNNMMADLDQIDSFILIEFPKLAQWISFLRSLPAYPATRET